MGNVYVMNNGGGTGKAVGAISVTYPSGSTCTCSNGTKTLRAKDTSGKFLFLVPSTGTWSVTSTDGTNTKSASLSIANYGVASTALSYSYELFNKTLASALGGQKYVGGLADAGYTWNITSNNLHLDLTARGTPKYIWAGFNNAVNLSGYKKLKWTVTGTPSGKQQRVGIAKANGTAFDKYVEFTAAGTYEIALDSYQSSYYILLYMYYESSGTATMNISRIWLE